MAMILCYITNSSEEEAMRIVERLLEKRIAACATVFPVKTAYLWKGKIEKASEYVALVKTKKGNWEKLKKEVKKIHSYETPCIIKINAEANDDYEKWLKKELKQ
ncbi:divalent-cation tolerance protein CutA [Candidatus Micrarchaeota archaeon]|nr:divalent-cation tolerance protein CutA [Candidatus Micrarchaeota archaeon]